MRNNKKSRDTKIAEKRWILEKRIAAATNELQRANRVRKNARGVICRGRASLRKLRKSCPHAARATRTITFVHSPAPFCMDCGEDLSKG